MRKALVDGMRLASIGLTDPIRQPVFILTDDVHAAVIGAAVNDDILNVGVVLVQDRQDGLLQELGLIVRWSNNADPRPW